MRSRVATVFYEDEIREKDRVENLGRQMNVKYTGSQGMGESESNQHYLQFNL